jgi:hypothetical protein
MTIILPGISALKNASIVASQQEVQSKGGFKDLINKGLSDEGAQTPPDETKNEPPTENDVTEADPILIEKTENEAEMETPQANSAKKNIKNANSELSQGDSVDFLPLQSADKMDNTDIEPKHVNKSNSHPHLGAEGAITSINSTDTQLEKEVANDTIQSPEVPILIAASSLSVMAEVNNTSEIDELLVQAAPEAKITPRFKTEAPFEDNPVLQTKARSIEPSAPESITNSSSTPHIESATSEDSLPLQAQARSAQLSAPESIANSNSTPRVESATSENSLPLQAQARSAQLSAPKSIANSSSTPHIESATSEDSLPLQAQARSAQLSAPENIANSNSTQRVESATSENSLPLQTVIVDRIDKQNPVPDKTPPQIEISKTSQATKQASIPTTTPSEAPNIRPADISAEAFRPVVETQSIQADQVSPRNIPKSPIVQNVMAHIQSTKVEPGTITVRLRPDGLGIVELQITQDQDGTMEVSLRAKNPMVLDALRLERHAISDILTQQGAQLKQEGINFDHFGSQGGKAGSNATKDENSSQITGDESDHRDQDGVDDEQVFNQESDLQSETNILI